MRAYFPTYVYQEYLKASQVSLRKLNLELVKEAYKIRDFDAKGRRWSKEHYPNGYTSYGSLFHLNKQSSTFAALEAAIDIHVKKFSKHLGFDLKDSKLEMVSCWVNIMSENSSHSLHLHPLSTLSGSYYVKMPEGSGDFKIEDPRLAKMMAAPARKEESFVRLKPIEGEVILFESWLRHEVAQKRGVGEDRISVSFNYNWF